MPSTVKRRRIPRPVSVPMLIHRGLRNDDLELREWMLVEAFAQGFAAPDHFDGLADMRDLLLLGATQRGDDDALRMARAAGVALVNIRERHGESGRLGASGPELTTLREFVTVYGDFWRRQSVGFYTICCDGLDAARKTRSVCVEIRR